ncbi:hypothetical protein K438DRAFT_1931879 [Mycena galopus ATCC 62051]|nr:hypothetical protein K438DRAFT_1931879 [Mycena galopus ATCC 62051]
MLAEKQVLRTEQRSSDFDSTENWVKWGIRHIEVNRAKSRTRIGTGSFNIKVGGGGGGASVMAWRFDKGTAWMVFHPLSTNLASRRTTANFEFMQTDLSEGLPACRDATGYDLNHARTLHGHLKDPVAFIRHVDAVLRRIIHLGRLRQGNIRER